MRALPVLLFAVLCGTLSSPAPAAVTVLSATRRVEATSSSHQCSDGFPGAVGQTLVSTSTDTGQFTNSVYPVSTGTPWGAGSAGIASFIGSGGVSLPSFWAAVSYPLAGGCFISSSTARSARATMTVTFQFDEPTAYTFTGSVTQNSFSSGFSGSRGYGLNFAGMGFSEGFVDGGNVGGGNRPGPDDSQSISRQGVLPAGTYTFSASISINPQAPPSYSSASHYQIAASLVFVPEPGAAALLLLTLGTATAVRRRRADQTTPPLPS